MSAAASHSDLVTGTTREWILSARGLARGYGAGAARVQVLHGVDLDVRRGEFLAIMGESGCGKSTLLHILGLMLAPDAGTIAIDGHDATGAGEALRTRLRRDALGFVFQRFNLLPTLSARDNLALSLRLRGLADGGRITELLERMGVAHLAKRKPSQMSIGQQQRLAVARGLAHRPALLLADEPTGNLDSSNADALLSLFREANRADGQTIVMITHSAAAAAAADRTLTMRDGRIEGIEK